MRFIENLLYLFFFIIMLLRFKKSVKLILESAIGCKSYIKIFVKERWERIHIFVYVAFIFKLCFTYLSNQKFDLFHARIARRAPLKTRRTHAVGST